MVLVQYIVLVAAIALLGVAAFGHFGSDASRTIQQQGPNVARMGF